MLKGGVEANYLKFLSQEDIEKIHQASMQLLEEVGVKLGDKEALELCEEKGAKVDYEKKLVYFDRDIATRAVESAPSTVTIYSRDESKDNVELGGTKVYLGTGGTALSILNLDRNRVKTTCDDVQKTAKLVDALDNIHFYLIPCYPNEIETKDADVNRFYHAMNNTTKPIMGGVYTIDGCERVIDMATEIAGGKENLKEKPFISFISSVVSPLQYEDNHVKILMRIAEEEIPVATSCAPLSGATAPVTLAGTLAQINAEALAGVIMTQLVNPGAPVLYSTVPTIMDMKTMNCIFGSPEAAMMNAATAQLAQYYDLPLYSTGGITDSKQLDQQAGFEKAMTAILPALSGANFIHEAAGMLDSCMTLSYAQYVIDSEANGYILRTLKGIDVNEETLAVDVISKVGPGGDFLSQKHTTKHMRKELFFPELAARTDYAGWEKAGAKDLWDKAEVKAKDLLENYKPNPIPKEADEKIKEKEPNIKLD
ncbi:trimethylamine methyltransferase family protein [Natranaerofaba carboxydovora]|uniref:trimethylamine methyltransferase family protein n=1 Tax=Natranaerofaba carboxydovora TaxID=2742683 RepID=UPI001F13BAB7|nr:trimethylamine methyltransferase family protein [Natranaerofaba carboxydovora]UMZ73617.1 Trimethylamine methyltransferase (MTTB) [Natranaerofaba carboxydovora]